LIEGLALQTPPRSIASIHRQVVEIAEKQGWKPPGYNRVRQIIKSIDPALVTYAHQGAAAYREEFDLLYRREATHANAMWQADHTPLDVWQLDEEGKPAKPYLTAKELFMEEKKMHRQGDVLFIKVAGLPSEVVEHKNDVLVEGEATGHAHRLTEGQIWQTREGALFLNAVAGSKIVHEDHAPIELEPGYWQVIRQREYSPKAFRKERQVRD
jgi:hypothetical protein